MTAATISNQMTGSDHTCHPKDLQEFVLLSQHLITGVLFALFERKLKCRMMH